MKYSNDSALWWNEGAFLYIGRMGVNKGVEQVIGVWITLYCKHGSQCPDLWIAGGTPEEINRVRQNLSEQKLLVKAEKNGRIRWWGYLDSGGISSLLLKSRVLLMHSAYEPGGRVVLEALCQSVPVIATPHGFALDLIHDWITGFLVSYNNKQMLLHRMEHFVRQPLLGCSMGYSSKLTAKAALNSWSFYKQHADLYSGVLWPATPTAFTKEERANTQKSIIHDKLPRALIGRYPFPAEVPTLSDIETFASEDMGLNADKFIIEPISASGHSLLWRIVSGNKEWIVKHAYTVFINRALWDSGYKASIFKSGALRREKNRLASQLKSFVAIEKEDKMLGLQASRLFPNAFIGLNWKEKIHVGKQAIDLIAKESVSFEEAKILIRKSNKWWKARAELLLREPEEAVMLRSQSLRIAWPELISKTSQGEVVLPETVIKKILLINSKLTDILELEGESVLCMQHGDLSLHHVVQTPDGVQLIDGESLAIGWKGRDEAFIINQFRDDSVSMEKWLECSLGMLCKDMLEKVMTLSWLLIEATFQLARQSVLFPDKSNATSLAWFDNIITYLERLLEKFNP